MRTLASVALKALLSQSKPSIGKIIVDRNRVPNSRLFVSSSRVQNQNDPANGPERAWSHVAEEPPTISRSESQKRDVEAVMDDAEGPPNPSKPRDLSGYGSASRRAGRNIKKSKELSPPKLPSWFLEDNVILRENISNQDKVHSIISGGTEPILPDEQSGAALPTSEQTGKTKRRNIGSSAEGQSLPEGRSTCRVEGQVGDYEFDQNILQEISSLVATGLRAHSDQNANSWTSSKSDLVLCHPKSGGSVFLDEIVKHLAAVAGADLIRLDPQDIAEIGGPYVDESRYTHSKSLSSLGFDVYPITSSRSPVRESREAEDAEEEEEEEENNGFEEEEDEEENRSRKPKAFQSSGIIPIAHFSGNIMDLFHLAGTPNGSLNSNSKSPSDIKYIGQKVDTTKDMKMHSLIEAILQASELKRGMKLSESGVKLAPPKLKDETLRGSEETSVDESYEFLPSNGAMPASESLIIHVRDYTEINMNSIGGMVLDKLHEVVRAKRKDGESILIIGTSSSEDHVPGMSRLGFKSVQAEPENGPTRTVILPCRTKTSHTLLHDHQMRISMINLRNLQDMIRRISSVPRRIDLSVGSFRSYLLGLSKTNAALNALAGTIEKHVWSLDFVHHVAAVTLGTLEDGQKRITAKHVGQAMNTVTLSEKAKFEWLEYEKDRLKHEMAEENATTVSIKQPTVRSSQSDSKSKAKRQSEERMKKLRKICNAHEKKLLNGVVDPENIHTTFSDVRAPPETIEALKTLTSLSLLRPDAFTYGVLATDKIPGLLFYGPPGTGKTLLAKAVAKESGATVLEVSGSDVYDMYVGEGEKNVKAIFSLAKKLTPCIIFIDEADAILGSRGGSSNRTTHRELINQFLREWDGMNELSAFIMVATNRPFDLDEASIRRLPRRLLVDLPTERDREAILRIHLQDEVLSPEVSLTTLASQTPFYSGSDLKNLAVAAALSCVREEFDLAMTSKASNVPGGDGEPPSTPSYTYPRKRTLLPHHFAHALEEISASISDDMSSLTAIRKFDEKFGDRKGRRKRARSYGFETVKEGERTRSDAARVRNRN